MNTHTTHYALLAITFLSAIHFNSSFADDTEIYLNQNNLTDEKTRPNVVFVLDTSGSMGLPVEEYGSNRYTETDYYDPNTTYPGIKHASGGPGTNDYYYLYRRENSYANHFAYHNKVHINQMSSDVSSHINSLYNSPPRQYVYGGANRVVCSEFANNCRFQPDSNGEKVRAREANSNNRTKLYIVSGNFHNYLQSYYRYTVLQSVTREIINKPYNINLALMRFKGGNGGYVIKESVNAGLKNNQEDLITAINSMTFNGVTPLTETFVEASRYLRGESAIYGSKRNGGVAKAFIQGNTYDSPIKYACQKSHIILLTDGTPNNDNGQNQNIERLISPKKCADSYRNNAQYPSQSCMDEYAEWLKTDNSSTTKIRDHSKLAGDQEINVYTIGFGLNNSLLETTAINGGGENYTASTAESLKKAFDSALSGIDLGKDTFVAPSVSVNAYNGLQHRDELYFALFQPSTSARWNGNIKKYKMIGSVISDKNNAAAIDPETGYFTKSSLSYWTKPVDLNNDGTPDFNVDGDNIAIGGFATQLTDPDSRKIYTHTGDSITRTLTLTEELNDANTNITAALLGIDALPNSAIERSNILNWARGGVTNMPPPNYFMADFIHNQPSVVTYRTITTTDNQGNVTANFDDIVYAASNMGFFHAIDAKDGREIFSFIPKSMLPNLTAYYQNSSSSNDKVYGLDAPMTIWRYDDNKNGSIVNAAGTPEPNDFVYIYQPMRRGGTSLYALDVTRSNSPKVLWQIDGTAYDVSPQGDFRDLAQTWSSPQRGKIKWNCTAGSCTDKNVLFFAGGYDTAFDDEINIPPSVTKGNAIYMVDAVTGELLWSAGNGNHHNNNINTMNNSIAADVTVGDVDGDGYIDLLFAVDLRGGVWRMDFKDEPSSSANFAIGGQVADFGGGADTNFRRFYNAPDVAFFATRGSTPMLTVSVSSGYRAHPKNTDIVDYLFVMFDNNALQPPNDGKYTYVNNNSRIITFNDLKASPDTSEYGWHKKLNGKGEKGLSRTITFGNQIIMTTYLPEESKTCSPSVGKGRRYVLDALTGRSVLRKDNKVIPYADLVNGGIPPQPAVIYSTEKVCKKAKCDGQGNETLEVPNLIVCVGTECIDDVVDQDLFKMFWREN